MEENKVPSCLTLAAVGLHMASIHMPNPNLNSFNPGAYIRTECGIQAGAYYNSNRKLSAYVAYVHDFKLPIWVAGGAITGYPAGAVVPMAMVGVRVKVDKFRLRIGYVPEIKSLDMVHTVHFAIERKF